MKALWEEFGQLLGELVRLGEGGTPLQRLVASGVAGLMAQVEYGLRHYPGDPAAVRMQRLLEVLKKEVTSGVGTADKEALSGVWGAADKETWSGVWGAAGAEVSAGLVMSREGVKAAAEGSGGGGNGDWQKLKAKWSETKEWKEWVGQVVPEAAGESLPQVLWLVTHRVAAEVAERWQRQWRELAGELREHPQVPIAGPRTALLLPPIDKTDAPVVRMDPGAALDQRLPLRLGDHPLLQGMARACSAALWFIENDPLLHYAWHPINRFGLRPFDDDSRNRYIEALITCFAALQEAVERNEIRNVVIKWLELDEGINSLMYDPVPHPDSLFAAVGKHSRQCMTTIYQLASEQNLNLTFKEPNGQYRDCVSYTDPDEDVEMRYGGQPGQVVRCLRLYARIDKEVRKARLAYRPR